MSERSPEARKCPLCGKPAVQRYRPFCSKRCADIDLARWLKGTYAIPAEEGSTDVHSGGQESDAEESREGRFKDE